MSKKNNKYICFGLFAANINGCIYKFINFVYNNQIKLSEMRINGFLMFLLILFLLVSSTNSFSQVNRVVPAKPIIQIHDSSKVDDGYLLLMLARTCSLIDRQGNVLFNIPGNLVSFFNFKNEMATHNGNSLAIYNKDLELQWKIPTKIEHELSITDDDKIMFFAEEYDSINGINVYFNNLACVDSTQKKTILWSSLAQRRYLMDFMMKDTSIFRYKIEGSADPDSVLFKIAPSLFRVRLIPIEMTSSNDSVYESGKNRELFHMNAMQFLPSNNSEKNNSAFKKGNILLCFNNFTDSIRSFMAIIDPVNFKILWHYVQKDGRGLHTPVMLPNGHILVYVNPTHGVPVSSIDEINPLTNEVIWRYNENFPNIEKCNLMGSCQRLPNGNTLISNILGYVYEVTPDKIVVWQWSAEYATINGPKFIYRAYWYPKEKLKWLEMGE